MNLSVIQGPSSNFSPEYGVSADSRCDPSPNITDSKSSSSLPKIKDEAQPQRNEKLYSRASKSMSEKQTMVAKYIFITKF